MSTAPLDEGLCIASEAARWGNRSERRQRVSYLGPHARAFLIVPSEQNFDSYTRPRRSDFGGSPPVCDLQVRIKFLELIKIKKAQIEKYEGSRCARPQFIRPDRNGATCAHQGAHLSGLSINLGLVGLTVCRRRGGAPSNCYILVLLVGMRREI